MVVLSLELGSSTHRMEFEDLLDGSVRLGG